MRFWIVFGCLMAVFLCGCSDSRDSITVSNVEYPLNQDAILDSTQENLSDVKIDSSLESSMNLESPSIFEPLSDLDSQYRIKKCRTEFSEKFVPGKAVFMGNSLLLGYGLFGMDASSIDKDYFYRVRQFFEQNEIPLEVNRVASTFESMKSIEEQTSYLEENLYPLLSDSTDLIVLQLGDNMDLGRDLDMEESVSHLMENVCLRAPNARVLWVGMWYSSLVKLALIKRLAAEYGITFVDISDLNAEGYRGYVGQVIEFSQVGEFKVNYETYSADDDTLSVTFKVEGVSYTSSVVVESYVDNPEDRELTWIGREFIVANYFVASHPNDAAFAEIASRILGALGYSL